MCAPPCCSVVTKSFRFTFPPTFRLPFPVSDPNTPPVMFRSLPTSTTRLPPDFIPDCLTVSPFFHIFPPPALNPSSPLPIVLLAAPIETFPPAFALIESSLYDDF